VRQLSSVDSETLTVVFALIDELMNWWKSGSLPD
jgi:hypothetical protein